MGAKVSRKEFVVVPLKSVLDLIKKSRDDDWEWEDGWAGEHIVKCKEMNKLRRAILKLQKTTLCIGNR